MIGQNIGQYRVVAKIGEGGMGAVYEVVDDQIGRRAAIKVLHKDHAKNQQIATRFINEARAINVVDHPGVVQVSSFGQLPDGTAYIVMELLKGETLNARLKAQGGRMPMLEALRLARQLAAALAAAHAKGIIHRDLKPDNIMLVADSAMPGGERTKLLDFGIAKLKLEYQGTGDQIMTRAGVMMGTPLYMSPEQCRNASDVDDKADVYSLGVILYRMLVGRPPFTAPGTGELMAMHIYMQPPRLGDYDPTLPEPLVQLVHRMLAKNRVERPTMAQVAEELDRLGQKASGMMPIVSPQSLQTPAGTSSPGAQAPLVNESATVVYDNSGRVPSGSISGQFPPQRRVLPIIIAVVLSVALAVVGVLVGLQLQGRRRQQQQPPPPPPVTTPTTPNPPPQVAPPAPPAKVENQETPPPLNLKPVRWAILSEPSGAEVVQLDSGLVLGMTPLDHQRPPKPGAVMLELRLKGYQSRQISVDGEKNEAPTAFVLAQEPQKGRGKHKRKP